MRAIVQLASSHVQKPAGGAPVDEIARLRAQLERVQGRKLDAPVLPVHPALESLLPGGGLRPGAVYSLPRSTSVLLALLSRPSQSGSWCAAIGMPRLGAEAAEALGVDLSRLVLIPDPGARWLAVTATVADVLPVVAVRPSGRVPDAEVSRLAGRLRERGAVLLVQGPWPQAEAVIEIADPVWEGLGRGHGYLAGREVTLTAASRRWPRQRRTRVMLPDAAGHLSAARDASRPGRLRPVPSVPSPDEPGARLETDELLPLTARAVG